MADFSTHVFSAAALGSLGATLATKLLDIPMSDASILVTASLVGGVLPDIDLKYSWPSRVLFATLGLIAGLTWLFAHVAAFTALELWLGALGVFLLVRYPLWWVFHTFTEHRGVLHSLIAAVMAGVLMAATAYRWLDADAVSSWLLGIFLMSGYLLHLVLDELFSVDFMGVRIKRSFGSALKPLDTTRLPASCLVLFVTMAAWFWAPDIGALSSLISELESGWLPALLPDWLIRH